MMRLKIGGEPIRNISHWGLELIKSPQQYGGKVKDSNIVTVDFPEEDGVSVYYPTQPKTEAFDYKITFAFYSETLNQAASRISTFCGMLKGKKTVIYNDYKRVQLTGVYKDYADGEFYKDTKVVTFDVTFFVADPKTVIYS